MDTSANASSHTSCGANNESFLQIWLYLNLFLMPLFVFVLYVGYKQHQKQSPPSHSDIFTHNIITMEILCISGSSVYLIGMKFGVIIQVTGNLYTTGIIGQMCFHCLTCVDRYLAVVRPITYLHLKKRGGVMIRNIAIAGIWVISIGIGSLQLFLQTSFDKILETSLAFFLFVVVAFCSISMLRVLIRPGPGEGGRDLRRIDQSKQRAFIKIMIIMVVLLLRFVVFASVYLMSVVGRLNDYGYCVMSVLSSISCYPSSLVSPLMFLQKYGKLPKWSIVNCKLQVK